MYIYNITIKIDHSIEQRWLDWMIHKHIPEVMETGTFSQYRICRLLGLEETDGITFAIQYHFPDLDSFQKYQQEHAPRLKAQAKKLFPNKFVAFRTMMQILDKS
ncbi:MAG TPA: DUF4286 family protein [Saprospiraceae bacterium]|nr:DUF4286 family protein [Saprospiraceae bacterium]